VSDRQLANCPVVVRGAGWPFDQFPEPLMKKRSVDSGSNEFLDQVAQCRSRRSITYCSPRTVIGFSQIAAHTDWQLGCALDLTLFNPAALRIARPIREQNLSIINTSRLEEILPPDPSDFRATCSSTPRMGQPLFRRSRPSGSSVQSRRTPCTNHSEWAQSFQR